MGDETIEGIALSADGRWLAYDSDRSGNGDIWKVAVDGGQPVKVVYLWEAITAASGRWSQAFSYDGGQTWETNWIMSFTRSA